MKNVLKLGLVFLMFLAAACSKSTTIEEEAKNCTECLQNQETFTVCEEDGTIYFDGELMEDLDGYSLEFVISIMEENPNDDPVLEGITCN